MGTFGGGGGGTVPNEDKKRNDFLFESLSCLQRKQRNRHCSFDIFAYFWRMQCKNVMDIKTIVNSITVKFILSTFILGRFLFFFYLEKEN